MKIKYAHVGLGKFSLQRLKINLNNEIFEPVAYIDLNLNKNKEISNLINGKNFFTSITEAKKNIDFDSNCLKSKHRWFNQTINYNKSEKLSCRYRQIDCRCLKCAKMIAVTKAK